jgi:hypothetical protein
MGDVSQHLGAAASPGVHLALPENKEHPMIRLEFWPTRDGVHVVEIHPDRTVRHVGVLWI